MPALNTIELDGYDEDVFERLVRSEPALETTLGHLGHLLPHPRHLLADVFGVLFKLNIMMRPLQEISASVLVNRRLVESVAGHPGVRQLRTRTQLDEAETRDALVLVADRILRALTRRGRARPEDLVEGHEIAERERTLDDKNGALEHLENMDPDQLPEETREQVRRALKAEIRALKQTLDRDRQTQRRHADALPIDLDNEIGSAVGRMGDELSELDEQLRGLGLGQGQAGNPVDGRRRLELGERLAQSKKLRLLARLAGAFKEVAFEARRKALARSPQTAHAVTRGGDLVHMLPSEMLGLDRSRVAVHRDFLRRLVEGRLMQYDLRAPASRGPMVVCVDGSGSMTGSKEIWAKAVALTLMEIARREKRGCLAIVFSDGDQLFEVELLGRGARGSRLRVREEEVLKFAEHFPGGGTNFEAPLERALAAVTEGNYRNGDIIFITDGEASVSEALIQRYDEARRARRFKLRGLLVGSKVGPRDPLGRICDELRDVSELTGDVLTGVFAEV